MLCFIGIGKQAFDIGLKCGFGVRNLHVWRRVAHVLVIVVPVTSFGAVQVNRPSSIEAPTIQPRYERAEVFNGGLQCRKDGLEFSVHGVSIARPVSWVGVQASKDVEDGGAEHSASGGPTPTISGAIAKPSNEASGENAASYLPKVGEKEVDDFIHGALIGGAMMTYMLWVTGAAGRMKHNAKLTGVPPTDATREQ